MDALSPAPATPEDMEPSKEAPDKVAADPAIAPPPPPPPLPVPPVMAVEEDAPDGEEMAPESPPPARSICVSTEVLP